MRPAREGDIPVRVKNSYNPKAPGTLITRTRDMSKAVLTSIVVKRNVTMLDIELDHVVEELEKIAVVNLLQHRSIISLIGNVQRSSLILEKVNISPIVHDRKAEQCVRALHSAFFGSEISEVDRECGSQNGFVSILQN
ncbi:hypothetical protein LOK49_LG04G03476 [Camellia lanceoleosa]|uniref:Uncharacterized protein n=1 Tax=Camellia lanceoleosa TaxID=1840588 RepID=A0ACC0I122_9ERIC|nr:hypothetical protein LOK49_LG04G03476 [Camellia lanceoleosa]